MFNEIDTAIKMRTRATTYQTCGWSIAYIIEIDGKRIPKDKKETYSDTWDNVYPITTGENTLTVTYGMAEHYTQPTKITFDAKPTTN